MFHHRQPLLMAFDRNDDPIRMGDIVVLHSDRDHEATVVAIFGPNVTIEFPTGHREDAFGCDVLVRA